MMWLADCFNRPRQPTENMPSLPYKELHQASLCCALMLVGNVLPIVFNERCMKYEVRNKKN